MLHNIRRKIILQSFGGIWQYDIILSHVSPFYQNTADSSIQILRSATLQFQLHFDWFCLEAAVVRWVSDLPLFVHSNSWFAPTPSQPSHACFFFFFFLLHATFTRLKGGIIHRSLQNFSLFHPLVSKERATSGALCKVVSHSPQQRKTCASVFIISQTHLLAAQCCSSYWYHYS